VRPDLHDVEERYREKWQEKKERWKTETASILGGNEALKGGDLPEVSGHA